MLYVLEISLWTIVNSADYVILLGDWFSYTSSFIEEMSPGCCYLDYFCYNHYSRYPYIRLGGLFGSDENVITRKGTFGNLK